MITNPNVKINLGLNVLRKREDGFHDLETLFVPYFGINDTLEIVLGDDYSRTSAALFSKYGPAADMTQGSIQPCLEWVQKSLLLQNWFRLSPKTAV